MSNMGRPVGNKHKVPQKSWAKWSNHGKRVFNEVMHELRPSVQMLRVHPAATAIAKAHWQTIRWNAAFLAACAASKLKADFL